MKRKRNCDSKHKHNRKRKIKIKLSPRIVVTVTVTLMIAIIIVLLMAVTLLISFLLDVDLVEIILPNKETVEEIQIILPDGNLDDWNLILLNHDEDNKLDYNPTFENMKFNGQLVDARAGEYYQKMYEHALSDGITLYLRSGYRSIATQTVNYNANVQRLQRLGFSKDDAITETNLYYTVPGHSEHHTGLAFDIITPHYHQTVYTLNDEFAKTQAYSWLIENCADYGFILRYPQDKIDITKINFEPWHYRFVGVEHAQFITENNICFEEYIDLLENDDR